MHYYRYDYLGLMQIRGTCNQMRAGARAIDRTDLAGMYSLYWSQIEQLEMDRMESNVSDTRLFSTMGLDVYSALVDGGLQKVNTAGIREGDVRDMIKFSHCDRLWRWNSMMTESFSLENSINHRFNGHQYEGRARFESSVVPCAYYVYSFQYNPGEAKRRCSWGCSKKRESKPGWKNCQNVIYVFPRQRKSVAYL